MQPLTSLHSSPHALVRDGVGCMQRSPAHKHTQQPTTHSPPQAGGGQNVLLPLAGKQQAGLPRQQQTHTKQGPASLLAKKTACSPSLTTWLSYHTQQRMDAFPVSTHQSELLLQLVMAVLQVTQPPSLGDTLRCTANCIRLG